MYSITNKYKNTDISLHNNYNTQYRGLNVQGLYLILYSITLSHSPFNVNIGMHYLTGTFAIKSHLMCSTTH